MPSVLLRYVTKCISVHLGNTYLNIHHFFQPAVASELELKERPLLHFDWLASLFIFATSCQILFALLLVSILITRMSP